MMDKYDLERFFYTNTQGGDYTRTYDGDYPEEWTTIEYKEYDRCEREPLDPPVDQLDSSIDDALSNRYSPLAFTGESVGVEQLAGTLLGAFETHQFKGDGRPLRAYPSAGARYPLEVYVSAAAVEGLPDGLYHVNVRTESLERIHQEPYRDRLADQSGQEIPRDAAFTVFITAVPERSRRKYDLAGYRYLLFEAGHLMQNFLLLATSLSFQGRAWAAFIEHNVRTYLKVPEDEDILYLGVFGHTP